MREAHLTMDESAFEAMGIEELVAVCREAGQRRFEELTCHGNGAVVEVELERPIDEERLSDLPYVDRFERVAEEADGFVYVIGFTAPDLSAEIADHADDLLGTCDPDVGDHGTTMSLVGSQDTIRDVVAAYVEAGVAPELRKLGTYEGPERPLDRLTDRQREVLEAAYDQGYYDVPRTASTEEVADAVGVDASTVTEHLQRAERNLLTRHLSAGR